MTDSTADADRNLVLLQGAAKALAQVSNARDAWALSRTAEAARRFAQMRDLGVEAVNYAVGIKAKAMILLADFIDAGQADGTIYTQEAGRPISVPDENTYSLQQTLGSTSSEQARKAVHEARRLRDVLAGLDIDELITEANATGVDFGLRGLRRAAAAKHGPTQVAEPVAPAAGKFSCIVIDPPWPMPKIQRDERPDQGANLDYPTMTLEQLADETWLPVRTSAADNCHLYLWVTHRFLPYGLQLLAEWGFTYQCVMTWRKNVGITPFSWMYDTEHVLFARRGSLPLLRNGLRLSFEAPVTGHSIKPDVFYERVRLASPGPRLDMFPGVPHDDFQPWGLEATHRDVI